MTFAAGFSLVEVMVAMVIGLLGIIVMMQMFSVFEGQKRTTTGGDDANSSGAVSLYGAVSYTHLDVYKRQIYNSQ